MQTNQQTPAIRECRLGTADPKWFWESTGSTGAHLRAEITWTTDGPALRVFTGGQLSKHYVPSRTSIPVNLTAQFDVSSGTPVRTHFSAQPAFGNQRELPEGVAETAEAEATEWARLVLTTAPTFAERWDAVRAERAAKAAAKTAENLDGARSKVTAALASALDASRGISGPVRLSDLEADAHVEAIVARYVRVLETADGPDGAAVTAAGAAALREAGAAAVAEGRRLSEIEFIELATESAVAVADGTDRAIVRAIVQAVYNEMYDVNYNSGYFPDRCPGDELGHGRS